VNTLKKFVRIGWSKWYVSVAILTGLVLCSATADPDVTVHADAIFRAVGWTWTINSGYKPELLSPSEFERIKEGPAFGRMKDRMQDLSDAVESKARADKVLCVLCVTLITGYIGYSLDIGYKWLRKRRQQSTQG
jgi:hypothetical protein